MTQVAVDLSPLVNQVLIPLIETGLSAVAGWVLMKVGAYFHFQIQDGQRKVVNDAIDNGVALAQASLAGGETIHVDEKVAAVVDYVAPKVPGAMKALGITPDHLADIAKAKLVQ